MTRTPHLHVVRLTEFAKALTALGKRPITYNRMLAFYRRYPVILQVTTKSLVSNIRALAEGLAQPTPVIVQLILNEPDIARCKPATLIHNITDTARRLEVPVAKYLRLALKQRWLMRANPEHVGTNIKRSAAFLGYDMKTFAGIAMRCPQLFTTAPETLRANAGAVILAFDLTPEKFRKLARLAPHTFLARKSESLRDNIKSAAKVLDLTPEETLRVLIKRPALLGLTAGRIRANLRNLSKILGVPPEVVRAVVIKRPQLLVYAPATVQAHAEGCAAALGVSVPAFVQAAIINPHLFAVTPATLASKIPHVIALAKAMGHTYSPADTLAHCSIAYVYAIARIKVRLKMARRGIGPKNMNNLLILGDEKVRDLMS